MTITAIRTPTRGDGPDPRALVAACSLIDWHRWGMCGQAVMYVLARSTPEERKEAPQWVEFGRDWAAQWLQTKPRHARRVLVDLVAQGVLERRKGEGQRPSWYRLTRDPRRWRDVPWRVPYPKGTEDQGGKLPPELVIWRLENLLAPPPAKRRGLVVTHRGTTKLVDVHRSVPANPPQMAHPEGQLRTPRGGTPGASVEPSSPSSTSSGPTAPVPTADQELAGEGAIGADLSQAGDMQIEKEKKAGPARPTEEEVALGPGAEAIATAIWATKKGPVKNTLRRRLAEAFGDAPVDGLGPIIDAVTEAAVLDGQRPPAQVDIAVEWYRRGLHVLESPRLQEIGYGARLAELRTRWAEVSHDLEEASAEGNAEMVGIFTSQLRQCEHDIDVIERAQRERP